MEKLQNRSAGTWKEKVVAYYRENRKMIWYQAFSFTLIFVSALWAKTNLLMLVPIFIAHIYMVMQNRANRYMFLVTCVNSVFYGVAYLIQGLYTSAAYAILFSSTMNLISFFNWKKRTQNNETKLRRMTMKQFLLLCGGFVAVWLLLYVIFSMLGSPYILLDNTATILGAIGVILGIFSFIECTVFQVLCCFVCVILYIQVIFDQPTELPYLINNALAMGSSFICFVSMMKIYQRQQEKERNGGIGK